MEAGGGVPESSLDFTFGFNDPKYSDRILLLEIAESDENCSHLRTNVKRPSKKKKKKKKKSRRRHDLLLTPPTTAPLVNTIHISSLILAARSSFFRKLFSNGMLETQQKNITLRIPTAEEAPLMDLLKYVYSNKLPNTLNALLHLLLTADKFEVASCLRDCIQSLQTLPMTCESALLYLGLPQSLLMFSKIQPLIDAAKKFLVAKFKDFHKFEEEIFNLPLVGIQTVLSSDDLQVTSECAVYDFVLTWVYKHYPDLDERRGILKTHLLHLIRFPFMTISKLTEEVQTCTDIDPEVASKIVIRALCFKAETPYRKHSLAAEEGNAASRQFVKRAYKCLPVQLVELALPHEQRIVYLHFTREKLRHIFPEGEILSQTFHLGEQQLDLLGRCSQTNDNRRCFWLGLEVLGTAACTVKYEIQLRRKPEEAFKSWDKGSHTFTTTKRIKYFKYGVPWDGFIGDDSPYFINDLLHVRAELTAY